MLNGQQDLACNICCRGVLTAELLLTCGTRISFDFLKKSKVSKRGFLFKLLSPCEEPRFGLSQMNDGSDILKNPHQVEYHSRNDPHLVPCFLRPCSGMFPKGFEVCPYLWVQDNSSFIQSTQNAGLCSAEFLGQSSCNSAFNHLETLRYIMLVDFRNGRFC